MGGSGVCCTLRMQNSLPCHGLLHYFSSIWRTYIESSQYVQSESNPQVINRSQDQCHKERSDTVALSEQGHDGEADQNPEEQRDQWGIQHSWEEKTHSN